jgi:hypothetical protein
MYKCIKATDAVNQRLRTPVAQKYTRQGCVQADINVDRVRVITVK